MYIYKITNNLNNKIYIGLKTSSVEESTDYYGSGKLIKRAIDKYGIDNFTKTILERDITDYDYLCERERHYIDIYDSLNNGYNMTAGGEGLLNPSDELRKRLSESAKARGWNKNTIEAMAKRNRGRKLSKEHIEATRQGRIKSGGWSPSEKTRRKISETLKGKPLSEEHKRKISEANKGRTCSEEHKRKVGAANAIALLGNVVSEETKQKIRETLKNKPKLKCPHCGLKGKGPSMYRFHFDNCKHKNC